MPRKSKAVKPWHGAQCFLCAKDADGYYPEWTDDKPGPQAALVQHLSEVHGVTRVRLELSLHLNAETHFQRENNVRDADGRKVGVTSCIVPRSKEVL